MRRERPPPHAYSFLLRIRTEPSAQPPYRVVRLSVEAPHGVRRDFESSEALARYLDAIAEILAHGGDVGDVDV